MNTREGLARCCNCTSSVCGAASRGHGHLTRPLGSRALLRGFAFPRGPFPPLAQGLLRSDAGAPTPAQDAAGKEWPPLAPGEDLPLGLRGGQVNEPRVLEQDTQPLRPTGSSPSLRGGWRRQLLDAACLLLTAGSASYVRVIQPIILKLNPSYRSCR